MFRRLVLAAAVALAIVVSVRRGQADDDPRERSRAAFRKGVAQAQEGNYAAARDSFLEAYKVFPHPSILLNLGIARAHTGQYLEAEQDLVHFLADDGGAQADELVSARAELGQVRGHLGTFRLHVAPDGSRAMLDMHAIALMPGGSIEVRTTRGVHDVRVDADGYVSVDRSIVIAGDRAPDVDIALAPVGTTTTTTAPGEGRRTAAWFLLGAGAVAAGIGIFSGIEAKSLADDYNTQGNASFHDASTKARGLVFRTSADVAFLGALALGGAGVYFMLTSPSKPPAAQARLLFGPGWTWIAGAF